MSHRVFSMSVAKVYPMYVQKAERKGRTKEEVDTVIRWLTGYDQAGLEQQLSLNNDFTTFFEQAPAINPKTSLIALLSNCSATRRLLFECENQAGQNLSGFIPRLTPATIAHAFYANRLLTLTKVKVSECRALELSNSCNKEK